MSFLKNVGFLLTLSRPFAWGIALYTFQVEHQAVCVFPSKLVAVPGAAKRASRLLLPVVHPSAQVLPSFTCKASYLRIVLSRVEPVKRHDMIHRAKWRDPNIMIDFRLIFARQIRETLYYI